MELQGKMQETNQKLRIADVQVESLKKQIVHAQLTDKEIQVSWTHKEGTGSTPVVMYCSVFILVYVNWKIIYN